MTTYIHVGLNYYLSPPPHKKTEPQTDWSNLRSNRTVLSLYCKSLKSVWSIWIWYGRMQCGASRLLILLVDIIQKGPASLRNPHKRVPTSPDSLPLLTPWHPYICPWHYALHLNFNIMFADDRELPEFLDKRFVHWLKGLEEYKNLRRVKTNSLKGFSGTWFQIIMYMLGKFDFSPKEMRSTSFFSGDCMGSLKSMCLLLVNSKNI